ncbi:MAG: fibronectin type III domain-containing protein, partial [Thermoplasmatales archaeon]
MHMIVKTFTTVLFALLLLNTTSIDVYSTVNQKESPSVVVGPFTQNTKLNTILVIWKTDIQTSNNEVHWGLTQDLGNISSEKYENFFHKQNLHNVRLDGLIPSTKYFYKVISDGIESK